MANVICRKTASSDRDPFSQCDPEARWKWPPPSHRTRASYRDRYDQINWHRDKSKKKSPKS